MIRPLQVQTTAGVADHYDELDPFYRAVWGDHVHHGLWVSGRETPAAAVEALVDAVADRLDAQPGQSLCDIGCGYGATARRLAATRGVRVVGVTVSGVQARHAAAVVPPARDVEIRCQDWLANDFADASFDGAYAIESSEHMPDKPRFFAEAARTLRPGGRLVVCAWLAREAPRPWEIRHLLEPICREGRLPGMGSESEYRTMAASAGLTVVSVADVSLQVRRTWTICARRVAARLAGDRAYRRFILDKASRNRIFALTLLRLIAAYRTGSMRYAIMTAVKPA